MGDIKELDAGGWIHTYFHSRVGTVTLYTRKVEEIFSAALNASNIRHPPIASRIKSWKSAKQSIIRRNRESGIRLHIRRIVEVRGECWKDYAREAGFNETEFNFHVEHIDPSRDPAAIFKVLQDLVEFEKFIVVQRIEKGQGSQDSIQSLEKHLKSLQFPERDTGTQDTANARRHQQSIQTFAGHKITNFLVKMHDEDIEDNQKDVWKYVMIEIQVGTLVSHMWSDIEHEMIYKLHEKIYNRFSFWGPKTSEDEEAILDLIKGTVLTGEAVLRRLEAITTHRFNGNAFELVIASSQYELAHWVEYYFESCRISFKDARSEWRHMDKLFAILKVTEKLQGSHVKKLIKDATQRTLNRDSLPTEMLWALCKEPATSEWPPESLSSTSELDIAQHSRLWALRLVHSVNLALYFEVAEEFMSVETPTQPPPLWSLLDILNPNTPRYTSIEDAVIMMNYCKEILSLKYHTADISNTLVKVAMKLPGTHRVCLTDTFWKRTTPIPTIILWLFPCRKSKNAGDYYGFHEFQASMEIIDFCMSSQNNPRDRWEEYTFLEHHFEAQAISLTGQGRAEKFLVPVKLPSLNDDVVGLYKVTAQILDLSLETMDPEETSIRTVSGSNKFLIWKDTLQRLDPEFNDDTDDLVKVAHRVYPKYERKTALEAWNATMEFRRKLDNM